MQLIVVGPNLYTIHVSGFQTLHNTTCCTFVSCELITHICGIQTWDCHNYVLGVLSRVMQLYRTILCYLFRKFMWGFRIIYNCTMDFANQSHSRVFVLGDAGQDQQRLSKWRPKEMGTGGGPRSKSSKPASLEDLPSKSSKPASLEDLLSKSSKPASGGADGPGPIGSF